MEIRSGLEAGFAHCCGADNFMMEIDCSEGLLRCYYNDTHHWKQTFGRYCKKALSEECYSQACTNVCDAYREVDASMWNEVIR